MCDLDIAWLEEPRLWDNDREDGCGARRRRHSSGGWQSESSRFGCRDLMNARAIDICNFDASWGGGPYLSGGVWPNWPLRNNVQVLQHLEPQIGLMMSAGVSNGFVAEVMLPWRDPFFYRLIGN